MDNFHQELKQISQAVNEKMANLLPEIEPGTNGVLAQAMRYSALSPGKRLRPFLVVVSCELFGVSSVAALQTAAAIEFIHSYSLIHDDLPAMDNDDFRRGQPSCHKKFNEAAAILAGNALLTLAFEILSDPSTHPDSHVRCELMSSVSKAIGVHGMLGGQMLDISLSSDAINSNDFIRMQRMKTGDLFAVSCESGAILAKASRNLRLALRGYAHALGLAFQITDDLLDYKQDNDRSPQTENHQAGASNYLNILGIDKAKEQAKMLISQAISHLSVFDHRANLLVDLANYVLGRQD